MRFPALFLVPVLAVLAVSSGRPLVADDEREIVARATSTQEAVAYYTTLVETQHTTQTSFEVVTATETQHVTEIDTVTAYVVASGLPCQAGAGGGHPVATFTDTAVGATSTSTSSGNAGHDVPVVGSSNNHPNSGGSSSNSGGSGSSSGGSSSNSPGSTAESGSTSPLTVPIARPDGTETHVDMDVPNMTPIVPPNVDPSKIENIKPVDEGDMYYSPDGHNGESRAAVASCGVTS